MSVTWLQAAALGVVQGLTEFFPVSSDGHLSLLRIFLNVKEAPLALDVAMHVGTLGSILVVFRRDLAAMARSVFFSDEAWTAGERRRAVLIVAACAVTGVIGLGLKDAVERFNASVLATSAGLAGTAAFLFLGEWRLRREKGDAFPSAPLWHALLLGLVQGLAVWPGLSRSGSTIATAMLLGWRWESGARFSFLMAVPATAGAIALLSRDITHLPVGPTLLGAAVSFAVGCAAIWGLMRFLRARLLWPFAVYCAALAALALASGFGR